MHPIIFKLKYQNPRRFENLHRSASVFENDERGFWCVVLSDEGGKSWIEKGFSSEDEASKRKSAFIQSEELHNEQF
jgi:hypothetical protein